ncbi:hypothetical protein FOA52_008087 [Chlamydomonas sp. UWO 241]|nr:hypothetical protein FOA52_008087 [Chlamydomonas sp. UWO 241]
MLAPFPVVSVSLLLLALSSASATTTPTWPFRGQGVLPTGRVLVEVNVHLDKLVHIVEDERTWRAVVWVQLTWQDTTAFDAVRASTQAWADDVRVGNQSSADSVCALPCDSSASVEAGCCDTLWLPHIEFPNLMAFRYEDISPRWRIWLSGDGTTVNWAVRVDADWFSVYDFRAWPLEHQHLLIEMQPSVSIASRVALRFASTESVANTPHSKGEDLPGYFIQWTKKRVYDTSACYNLHHATTHVWAVDNTSGAVGMQVVGPADWYIVPDDAVTVTVVDEAKCSEPDDTAALTQYGPHLLVVDMMVRRQTAHFMFVYVGPLAIITLLGFVAFAMDAASLESRMAVVLAVVLSISALQFMFDFPLSGYLNPIQILTLTSYVLFALIALECIVVAFITNIHPYRRRMAAIVAMAGPESANSSGSGSKSLFTKWASAKGPAVAPAAGSTADEEIAFPFQLSEHHTAADQPVVMKLTRDEAYAVLLAAKVDKWSCLALFCCWVLVFVVVITVGSAVGDHKLMLSGSMPGNA